MATMRGDVWLKMLALVQLLNSLVALGLCCRVNGDVSYAGLTEKPEGRRGITDTDVRGQGST
jgi:hypothetical protein